MRIVPEAEFAARLSKTLDGVCAGCVLGPGRSGAVASVYASHILSIPFLPAGSVIPAELFPLLIIDTARESGATLRKFARRYSYASPVVIAVYEEPPRVAFWYEAPKPQRLRPNRRGSSVVERCPEESRVAGSIPALGTISS